VEKDRSISSRNFKPFILITEDGGATWREINLEQFIGAEGARFSTFYSLCIDRSGKAWMAGDAGIIEATIEFDALQTSAVTMTRSALKDVSCNDSGEVWAVGDEGLIMHYQEKKWTSIQYPDSSAFYNRVKVIGNAVWLVGGIRARGQDVGTGLLLKSHDGKAWEAKTPDGVGLLTDLDFAANEGWLVGTQGSIYHTTNGGEVWQKEISSTENDLFCIFLLNAKRGWIGGNKLTVLGLESN
jgi:photosystem II stability/assembly factor-like uncharacterized protein